MPVDCGRRETLLSELMKYFPSSIADMTISFLNLANRGLTRGVWSLCGVSVVLIGVCVCVRECCDHRPLRDGANDTRVLQSDHAECPMYLWWRGFFLRGRQVSCSPPRWLLLRAWLHVRVGHV